MLEERTGGCGSVQCPLPGGCNCEEEKRGQTEEMQRGSHWHPSGKVLGNVIGGVVGKLRRGENLMQNGPGGEEERRCMQGGPGGPPIICGRQKRQTNEMQNRGEGEEERRGQTNEMQRGWHPTGKVLGNVIGGVVGKLRGENLMQNGPGGVEEERRYFGFNGQEKRQGENMMQNGPDGQEKRQNMMQNANGQEKRQNMMQNANGQEKRSSWNNPIQMQE